MSKTFKGGISATATMVALVAVLVAASLLMMGCASDKGGGTGGGHDDGYTDIPIPADIQTLAGALDWLSANAVDGGVYTVTVKADEAIQGRGLNYGGKQVSITLKGDAAGREVRLSGNGSLFYVDRGVTLNVENLTLKGRGNSAGAANDSPLVRVNSSGVLRLKAGAVITENYNSEHGGGVGVGENAEFIMESGEISGNTAIGDGGGVKVDGGTFTMSGGTISNNTASGGGGVHMWGNGSSFIMTGGTISGNTINKYFGAGLSVGEGCIFSKAGGIIYGDTDTIHTPGSTENTAPSDRGGHAVFLFTPRGSPNWMRNSDAGPGVNMSWDGTTAVGFDGTSGAG